MAYTNIAPLKLKGVARAQKAFVDETRKIARSGGPLVELVISRTDSPDTMRLLAWRSMAATAAYLSDKNLLFTSNI